VCSRGPRSPVTREAHHLNGAVSYAGLLPGATTPRPMNVSGMIGIVRLGLIVLTLAWAPAAGIAQQRNINFDLLVAARAGEEGAVRTLLDQGANPDSRDRVGDTALNIAARTGRTALARLLVERGADVDLANLARVTPLMSAAFDGHVEIMKILLERKADVAPVDRVQKTARIYAAGSGNAECGERLIAA